MQIGTIMALRPFISAVAGALCFFFFCVRGEGKKQFRFKKKN